MDKHKLVVKSCCQLIRGHGIVFDLILGVLQQVPDAHRNLAPIATDILVALAVRSSPCPCIAEHLLVQLAQEHIIQNILLELALSPPGTLDDIELLPFIELTLRRDVLGLQALFFIRIKRGLPGLVCELHHHNSRQLPSSSSFAISSN